MLDEGVLAETLRELFKDGGLSRRVRLGVANQRTVLRTLDLPPVTDRKELEAAVRFQAQDQVPMPLSKRGARLSPARHLRDARGSAPAGRARGGPARHDPAPARGRARRRPAPGGHRPVRLRADPLALPARPRARRPRAVPERRRTDEHGDRRGYDSAASPAWSAAASRRWRASSPSAARSRSSKPAR